MGFRIVVMAVEADCFWEVSSFGFEGRVVDLVSEDGGILRRVASLGFERLRYHLLLYVAYFL